MPFQRTMNGDLPIGVEGDFASTNPYHTLLGGESRYKAGKDGVWQGRFAWIDAITGLVSNVKGTNTIFGFVYRDQTAVNAGYLGGASLLIPKGFGVTLYDGGDFLARFANGAVMGQKVYASETDGTVIASDADKAGYTNTGFTVASNADANQLATITKY